MFRFEVVDTLEYTFHSAVTVYCAEFHLNYSVSSLQIKGPQANGDMVRQPRTNSKRVMKAFVSPGPLRGTPHCPIVQPAFSVTNPYRQACHRLRCIETPSLHHTLPCFEAWCPPLYPLCSVPGEGGGCGGREDLWADWCGADCVSGWVVCTSCQVTNKTVLFLFLVPWQRLSCQSQKKRGFQCKDVCVFLFVVAR